MGRCRHASGLCEDAPVKAILAAVLFVLAAITGATWYLSRRIHRSAFRAAPGGDEPMDLQVVAVSDTMVRLCPLNRTAASSLRQPGRYGLALESGYGQVSDMRPVPGANAFDARFEPLAGAAPWPGDEARIDSFAFAGDPRTSRGLEWEPVEVRTPLGAAPAWLIPADSARWALLVHGKGASREETLRMLPLLHEAGWTSLIISYRNDSGCARPGCYCYGCTEWEDLQAAVEFALDRGASDTLLVGYSMGGAIALSFLNRSPLAPLVRALILDSPMTDLRTLLHLRGRAMRIPAPVLATATRRALKQAAMAADDLDYHASFARDDLPVLLFHGDADAVIPVALSDAFAANRPNVTYHRVPGAGHVRSWNADQELYETAVRTFLAVLVPTPTAAASRSPER